MDERRLEMKVGALTLAALGVGALLVVLLSGAFAGKRRTLVADFAYAGGLPSGALVKFAGVKVGRVTEVLFRPEARDETGRSIPVRLVFEIDVAAADALRADANAAIGAQGALGESHLELLPGSSPLPLPAGAAVRGLDPPRLDVLLSRFSALMDDAVNEEAFRRFLVDVAKFVSLVQKVAVENGPEIATALRDAAGLLGEGRAVMGDLRVAARSASKLMADPAVETMIDDLATTAALAREELPGLVVQVKGLMRSLESTAGALSPEDVVKARGALEKLDQLMGRLGHISADAESLLAGIERGEGTAGRLMKDPKVYDEMRALLEDLKSHPWKLVWKK